jgi:hypothetical protein
VSASKPPPASPRDRAHFAAIAKAEEQSEEERIEDALRTSPAERMRAGFEMGVIAWWTPAHLAELDARTDGQMELARRRIALGLGLGPGAKRGPR